MTKYVLANWKSHKSRSEAEKWIETFLQIYPSSPRLKVILAPSFIYLEPLFKKISESGYQNLYLAAQDISPYPPGAYTGAVAADMVSGLAAYVLAGHAERRRYFHETNQEIAGKVRETLDAGIQPVLCVDRDYARAQIAALDDPDIDKLIIGYAPAGYIGLDTPQNLTEAKSNVKEIRQMVPSSPILYGGSIRADNAADYIKIEEITGLMVGSGCLNPQEFAAICNTVAES
ncbi:MAG: triose-phosphate isomerase [Thermodesulfobacteriota bacterium]